MDSQVLNLHPDILSLSEFFSALGQNAFSGTRVTGDRMWRLYSGPGKRMNIIKGESFTELLYPFSDPLRILGNTLIHGKDSHDETNDRTRHRDNLPGWLCIV